MAKVETYQKLTNQIYEWNSKCHSLFHMTLPTENLDFTGVIRIFCIDNNNGGYVSRSIEITSKCTAKSVVSKIAMKFAEVFQISGPSGFALYEHNRVEQERKLDDAELPLLIQLRWVRQKTMGGILILKQLASPRKSIAVASTTNVDKEKKTKYVSKHRFSDGSKSIRKLLSFKFPGKNLPTENKVVSREQISPPIAPLMTALVDWNSIDKDLIKSDETTPTEEEKDDAVVVGNDEIYAAFDDPRDIIISSPNCVVNHPSLVKYHGNNNSGYSSVYSLLDEKDEKLVKQRKSDFSSIYASHREQSSDATNDLVAGHKHASIEAEPRSSNNNTKIITTRKMSLTIESNIIRDTVSPYERLPCPIGLEMRKNNSDSKLNSSFDYGDNYSISNEPDNLSSLSVNFVTLGNVQQRPLPEPFVISRPPGSNLDSNLTIINTPHSTPLKTNFE